MPTAGHEVVVAVSIDDTTYTTVAGLNQIELAAESVLLDVTSFDDTFDMAYIYGLRDSSLNFGGDWEQADAGQQLIQTRITARLSLWVRVLWDGTNGLKAEALFSNNSTSATVDGKVELAVSGKTSGPLQAVP